MSLPYPGPSAMHPGHFSPNTGNKALLPKYISLQSKRGGAAIKHPLPLVICCIVVSSSLSLPQPRGTAMCPDWRAAPSMQIKTKHAPPIPLYFSIDLVFGWHSPPTELFSCASRPKALINTRHLPPPELCAPRPADSSSLSLSLSTWKYG